MMDLLCHRSGGTKAFKGKGEILHLARQTGTCMADLVGEMRLLSRTSKDAARGRFHYLELHRRSTRRAEAYCLRWRSALHRHVRWSEVTRDVQRLPLGLHDPYRQMNRKACELNALFSLFREQEATLVKLALTYELEEEGLGDRVVTGIPEQPSRRSVTDEQVNDIRQHRSPDKRCAGGRRYPKRRA